MRLSQPDARSLIWIDDLRRDVRYALRTLAWTPAFTIAAILTLAVGIGGATAVFSLIEAVLLRPLPFPAADRVVMVYEDAAKFGFPRSDVAPHRDHAADFALALAVVGIYGVGRTSSRSTCPRSACGSPSAPTGATSCA